MQDKVYITNYVQFERTKSLREYNKLTMSLFKDRETVFF